jgi:SdpC family antimicrobial peptide
MLNCRSHLTRAVALLALTGQVTLFAACSDVGAPTQVVATRAVVLSGQDIFRGVFFGEGPAGGALPEIWGGKSASERAATPERAAEIRQMEEGIVDRLQQSDPAIFSELESAVRSGDHFQVERALLGAGTALKQEIAQMETQPELFPCVVYDVAVVAVVVAVVFLVISQFDVTPVVAPEPVSSLAAGDASTLQRDMVVDLVTRRLDLADRR